MSKLFFHTQSIEATSTPNILGTYHLSEMLLNIRENQSDDCFEENILECELIQFENPTNKSKKYVMHTLQIKKESVLLARQTDLKTASQQYNVPLKSLKRWMRMGPERRKGGGRKIRDPDMEKRLYEWYLDHHVNKKLPITSRMIKDKALSLTSLKDFNASKGWLEKIKKKYNLQISRSLPSSKKKSKIKFSRT